MEEVRLTLRIPQDLHARLVKLAEREMRSFNAQVVYMLREATEEVERQQKKE